MDNKKLPEYRKNKTFKKLKFKWVIVCLAILSCLAFTPTIQRVLLVNNDGTRIDGTNPLNTQAYGVGIPSTYTKQGNNGRIFLTQKSQLNEYKIRPAIQNEHVQPSKLAQSIVTSSNIVGQIFKPSQDNINGILLTLESAAGANFDTFESYADSAALQVQWVESNATFKALLEETIVQSGAKSMNIPMDAVVADNWINTVGSTDYTGFTFEMDFRQNKVFAQMELHFFIGDGTNTKSIELNVNAADSWERFEINEAAMTVTTEDATASPPDMSAITKIGFRLDDRSANGIGYIDNMVFIPAPGEVELKLWDMGASIPTTGVTALDDGSQYIELGDRGINGGTVAASIHVQLEGGKRLYTIKEFVAGTALEIPSNTLLTVNNYYALTIHYVDTNTTVFGPDSTFDNYYNNGYGFTAPDEATAITELGVDVNQKHCMFIILSTQDVFIRSLVKTYNAAPGDNATETMIIEDPNMRVTDIISGGFSALENLNALDFDRQFQLLKGGKFEIYHNDDFTDDVSQISIILGYIYEPQEANQ
ncbi:MAG: hypothetical protein KAR42_14840 [candidate division Zixibacteria bacterium]|nr:hypothetical protein [candidate division Zixibacteria bacterium]